MKRRAPPGGQRAALIFTAGKRGSEQRCIIAGLSGDRVNGSHFLLRGPCVRPLAPQRHGDMLAFGFMLLAHWSNSAGYRQQDPFTNIWK